MNSKVILKLTIYLFLNLSYSLLHGQVHVSIAGDGYSISPVLIGFNGRSTEGPSWTDSGFLQYVDSLYPGTVRYPAGTQSNYWDWRTGTFIEGCGKTAKYTFTISDFVAGLPVESEIIYAVNIARPTPSTGISIFSSEEILASEATLQAKISDILDALGEFESWGRLPLAAEIGNEFYFDSEHAAIYAANPSLYIAHTRKLISELKSVYPGIKILLCTSKGGTVLRDYWNKEIFNALAYDAAFADMVHAVVQHHYINSAYGDPADVTDTGTAKKAIAEGILYTAGISGDYDMVPEGTALWITEYGATKENAEGTWASGLRAAAMTIGMLKLGNKIEILNFHHITEVPNVLNKDVMKAGPAGLSLGMLGRASRGKQEAYKLSFTNNTLSAGNTESLHGFAFTGTHGSSLYIINIGEDQFASIDLASVLPGADGFNVKQISSPLPYISPVYEGENLFIEEGWQDGIFGIPPFSVTLIESSRPVATGINEAWAPDIKIYPVLISNKFWVELPDNIRTGEVCIIDLAGRTVYTARINSPLSIHHPDIESGIYFIAVNSPSFSITRKVVKLR